jgi:outer membrane protein OmpA-like peptidoglycan-associated protein
MKLTRILTALAILATSSIFAQEQSVKKPKLFSYNISFSDYSFPKQIKDSTLSKAFHHNDWLKPGNKSFGMGVSYWKGLSSHIDFSGTLTGTFSNFPALFVKDDSIGQAKFSTQLDALLHLRMFREKAAVNPFLTAGIGAGYFPGQFALYAPLGTGLQFRFNQGAYLFLQMQWRKKLTAGISQDYLFYSFGFAQHAAFKKKKGEPVVEPVKPVLPPDKDGDGVEDRNDLCPDVKGTSNGCPDIDSDGVPDKDDQCKDAYGVARYQGCPIPDTDKDGINDEEDKCKDVYGVARYEGCPVPDTDKDGINDEEDKCPNEAGTVLNSGCPEIKQDIKQKIEFAARNILFEFASDVIQKKSYRQLNEVVTILKNNPELKLTISAHADTAGTPQGNMKWSERRAKAVTNYFLSKGIAAERISYKGFGDTRPIATNKTEAGRAKNRRVEMKVNY